ncbi:MAG: serine--tRNA ligase [Blastocatellia bacterium]|nr:serine--tRNA ligase [Blastocatellia bacterium]MBK6424917.1 serine--tRNA ligase [Blastocatellia bacterium]
MLDIQYVRENLDEVRRRLATRGFDIAVFDRFAELDVRRRKAITESGDLSAERNRLSPEIGALMKDGRKDEAEAKRLRVKELKERIEALETERDSAEGELNDIMHGIPNLPHPSVPVGPDESANVEIRRWGAAPELEFEPLDHVTLGEKHGILDLPRAAKITGTRFPLTLGAGALLERALMNFMLDVHTREHGYLEVLPPVIVNADSLFGTGQLPKFEQDLFKLDYERPYYLIPTAEVPVTNINRDEILDASELPKKMTAYTPCFRSEAGSFGQDTRGIIRVHQFNKVELVWYAKPEESYEALETLTNHAEEILRRLGLHYRVVSLSTGDFSASSAKTYDIEVWLPSQQTFREISSCSNFEAFQARRAQIRYRPEPGAKTQFVHTLNGSGLAIGRTWVAIVENFQQADGSIVIPEVLRGYMGGLERIG